jgi:phenylacetate-coenzyme A ligase PaaK-like adenylate-forming protein
MSSIKQKIILLFRGKEYSECLKMSSVFWSVSNVPAINEYQLNKFNQVWYDAYSDIPFYEQWKKQHSLPEQITSLDELSDWPILTKTEIQDNMKLFIRKSKQPDYYMMTGGSTGQPLRFGGRYSHNDIAINQWIGRARYGIYPETRTFLIWGHHHLYGKGLKSYIKKISRKIKDWIMDSYRVSAYDLSATAMQKAAKKMIKFRPKAVIGFSATVLAFCRTNGMNQKSIEKLGIECVICSAGPLTKNEQSEISSFFNAPLCMEYGSVECGVMAYTNLDTFEYDIFWNTHLIEKQKDKFGYKNIVTQLTSQYFTLIRYDIGDYLELPNDDCNLRPLSVKTIIGRPSDIVSLTDGTSFFGALIGDTVKQVKTITASQLYVFKDLLEIHVTSIEPLKNNEINIIKERCFTIVPELRNIRLDIIEKQDLYKTPAGKVPLVIYK